MKNLLPILVIAITVLMTACSKDAAEVLPGTWDTSDGGTITFDNDNTGTTSGSEFFEIDLGNGPIEDFLWELNGDNLTMNFDDNAGGTAELEFPVDVKKKNKVEVGVNAGFIDISVTLTR